MFFLESKKISFLGDQDSLIFFLNDSLPRERKRPPRHSRSQKRVAKNLQRSVPTDYATCLRLLSDVRRIPSLRSVPATLALAKIFSPNETSRAW